MKLSVAVKCFNALSKIKDKNSITDANIRFAVISNIISLSSLGKQYEEEIKLMNSQFTNGLIEKTKHELGEVQQKWQNEKDEAQKKFLELQFNEIANKIKNLMLPFQKDLDKLVEEINNKEQSVNLKIVDLQTFDAATSKIENISVLDFVDLSPMFKKEIIEKKKEEKK